MTFKNVDRDVSPVGIEAADSASVDAFGKWRTSEPFGIFDNKNIMTKNKNQWEELISGVIVVHGAVTAGPFVVGETVTGQTSLVDGIVDVVGAGSLTITVDNGNDFILTETILGGTSGASAAVTTINTGSDVTFLSDEAAVELKCGQLATDYAIRQTHRYHAYVPGKSQNVSQTFVIGAAKTNVTKCAGLYDDYNGIYLEQTETLINLVIRTDTSGSPVNTKVAQSDWNLDKLDGSGKSGITLDLTKSQIFQFDFQWLGVGRVRYGFNMLGMTVYVHQVDNANALDKVYMATPTLPLRYEIRNTGVPASDTTMKEICCSVVSEGGYTLPGFEFDIGSDFKSLRSINARVPIFAIRLKNTFNGKLNRRIGRFLHANFFATSTNVLFEIAHVHDPTAITATWADVGTGSGVEYSSDITAVTGRPEHIVGDTPVSTGQSGKGGGDEEDATFINLHSYFSQNAASDNSQIYVIYAQSDTGSANAWCSMKWIEFD